MNCKKIYYARLLGALGLLLMLLVAPPGALAMGGGDRASCNGGYSALVSDSGLAIDLPIYHFGVELITEGTNNYTVTRTMSNIFPLDMDFTIFLAWGYTGDKINFKIADAGDPGDRLFAVALGKSGSQMTPQWGTMYSSEGGDTSFTISIPVSQPGAIVYFFSGFFSPSAGEEAYTYTITASFLQ